MEWSITQSLVRPLMVIVVDVLVDQIPKMPLPEDDEMIQALVLDQLDPAFDVGVEVGGAGGQLYPV